MKRGMGWLKDYPDVRDLSNLHPDVVPLLGAGNVSLPTAEVPASVDLREWCSPIEDQGQLGACTAHAGVGLVEFFERKAFGTYLDASRLFLYKATRDLMQQRGDTGGYLRTTMGALALFGVPPERFWPYDITKFDHEPSQMLYALARSWSASKYFRLDPAGTAPDAALLNVKHSLANQMPPIFGFTVYSSIQDADKTGRVPFPGRGESVEGGHAIMAVGYDDAMQIRGAQTPGAILFRNSWTEQWGDGGYGWLPYDYVLHELADDWWTMADMSWMETGQFGIGAGT